MAHPTRAFLALTLILLQCHLYHGARNDIDQFLNREYKIYSSTDCGKLQVAYGEKIFTGHFLGNVPPMVKLTKQGDIYTLKHSSLIKTKEIKFQLGKEFDVTTLSRHTIKSVITEDGTNLIQTLKAAKGQGNKDMRIVREFSPSRLKVVKSVGDITCNYILRYP